MRMDTGLTRKCISTSSNQSLEASSTRNFRRRLDKTNILVLIVKLHIRGAALLLPQASVRVYKIKVIVVRMQMSLRFTFTNDRSTHQFASMHIVDQEQTEHGALRGKVVVHNKALPRREPAQSVSKTDPSSRPIHLPSALLLSKTHPTFWGNPFQACT